MDAARRAKTVLATATSVEVGCAGRRVRLWRHAVEQTGALLFPFARLAPECADRVVPGAKGPLVHAVASDVTSVPLADRVRGTVRLSGVLETVTDPSDDLVERLGARPGELVARVVPRSVTLEWHVESGAGAGGPVPVEPHRLAGALVDPLGGWQDEWMAHLDACHGESLRCLAGSVTSLDAAARVRPVLADEGGIVLREELPGCHRDIRVAFAGPARCGCEASERLEGLMRSL